MDKLLEILGIDKGIVGLPGGHNCRVRLKYNGEKGASLFSVPQELFDSNGFHDFMAGLVLEWCRDNYKT